MASRDITWPTGIRPQGRGLRIRIYKKGRVAYSETLEGDCGPYHLRQAISRRRELESKWPYIYKEINRPNFITELGYVDLKALSTAYSKMFVAARKRENYFLSRQDEENLIVRCEDKCELTSIYFGEKDKDWFRNPWAPSLDKINAKEGYTAENCRIVLTIVNGAMNEWGEDVLMHVAKALLTHRLNPKRLSGGHLKALNLLSN